MIKQRIEEIEKEIDGLIIDLLGTVRMSKTINKNTFDKFYSLLEELKKINHGEKYISRKLIGMLFYIYRTMASACEHAKYSDPIFIETAKVETYLDAIFWESPWT